MEKIKTEITIRDEVVELYERVKERYGFIQLEEMIAYAVGLGIQQLKQENEN